MVITMLYPIIMSSIAGISTLIGALFIYIRTDDINKIITFSLSMSLSVMIMISIFDLIPASLPYINGNIILFISSFGIGYLIVKILDKLFDKNNNLYKIGVISLIALMIHNLPEGILTFFTTYQNKKLGFAIATSIALHNIPEGISIAVPLYYSGYKKSRVILITFLSGIVEPLGGLISFLVLKNYIDDILISILLLVVAGIMITLSIDKMLGEVSKLKRPNYFWFGLIFGIIICIINIII